MRIYISGPMRGIENYEQNFKEAQEELEAQGHQVVNPCCLKDLDLDVEEYLNIDKYLVSICDAIYMLRGWKHSTGANIERTHAIRLDKKVYYEGSL